VFVIVAQESAKYRLHVRLAVPPLEPDTSRHPVWTLHSQFAEAFPLVTQPAL
jgi:hypothetical protein